MTLVPNETEQALNRQYDVYAAAREEYRKKIAEQAARIERLEAALREIMGMDEVAVVDFKKGDGWLHQRVASAALENKP